jgi:mannose/fructose/N-acetylgalactosamine-specific phosphotransferase system component IIC
MARAIQLALAPVFLLTGIAGLLNVMTGRLARIVDRVRQLNGDAVDPARRVLELRRHFSGIAITACTVAALLICIVIATLFVEVMLDAPLKWLVGGLFTAAMLALVVGLACFLREVHLAMRATRITTMGDRR